MKSRKKVTMEIKKAEFILRKGAVDIKEEKTHQDITSPVELQALVF